MNTLFKKIIIGIIFVEAKLMLLRYRPKIIAVAGSVGKTGTKDMIYQCLKKDIKVRKSLKSLNSEIGVPLSILGYESGWNDPIAWLKIMIGSIFRIVYFHNYPEWLILETGVDHPGDMEKIAKFLKPDIAVITTFGTVPVHVEYFDHPEDLMKEESKIIDYIKDGGSLILNADDPEVLKLKDKSHVKTYTYGITNDIADTLATNQNNILTNDFKGISFKANYEGNVIPVSIKNVLGAQYIYCALAGMTVAKILGLSEITVAESISEFVPAQGRMNLIKAKNDSMVIDDTYNSSPVALHKALEALGDLECEGNKIAILGDMLEIGRFSHSEHVKAGEFIKEIGIDYLITVGLRADEIAEGAIAAGMNKENISSFKTSEEAIAKSLEILNLKKQSMVLAKGSQSIRVEKIVKELIENPEKAGKLLVRQEKEWLAR